MPEVEAQKINMQGQCHCKQVSFSVVSEKKFEFKCYCTGCRVLNGSGHLTGMVVDKESFKSDGPISTYVYPGGSGTNITLSFCSNCSTQMYGSLESHPDVHVIRPSVLKDPDVFEVKANLFEESAFSWDMPNKK